MIKLNDVIEANQLLMTMGGEDQLPKIAAAAIERSLALQHRVDRALEYAKAAPPNSMHARQMARILDGSITVDDELNEVAEQGLPVPVRRQAVEAKPEKPTPRRRGPGRPKGKSPGLAGRSTKQRREFREWAEAQGYDLPRNAVAQEYIDEYDRAMEEQRRARASARQKPNLVLHNGEDRPEAAGGGEPQLFADHG